MIPQLISSEEKAYSLVLLPDTQMYTHFNQGLFESQTQWIRDQRDKLNIKYALHVGDVVGAYDGDRQVSHDEWEVARKACDILHDDTGKPVVPYAICSGNHDTQGNESFIDDRTPTRITRFHEAATFGIGSDYASQPTIGDFYANDKGEVRTANSYHLFETKEDGREWIVISLEWAPGDEIVAWADKIMHEYPKRDAILLTHAYMYYDNTRYDWARYGEAQRWAPAAYSPPGTFNDAQQLWDKLVSRHRFRFVFSGHVLGTGTGLLSSPHPMGHTTHQMLANYQMLWPTGGHGYLRVLTIAPSGKVQVHTYSPWLDSTANSLTPDEQMPAYLDQPEHRFTLQL